MRREDLTCAGEAERLVARVAQLGAEGSERGGDLTRELGPSGFDGEPVVVMGAAQSAEEAAEIFAMDTGGGAVFVFGDVGVANERSDFHDIVGGLAVAQHVENIHEQFHAVGVGATDGFGALENGVDAIAFAAVERFDEEGDAVFLGERTELAEDIDELFEGGGSGESWRDHAGTRAAEDDERHVDFFGPAKRGLGEAVEASEIYVGADDFQVGGEEAVRCGEGEALGEQGLGRLGAGGVGGFGLQEFLCKALNKIDAGRRREEGERGSISADSESHEAEE